VQAQQAHTRRVSTLQDECAAKLDAAQARLLEAERESSAAQAQLQAKVGPTRVWGVWVWDGMLRMCASAAAG